VCDGVSDMELLEFVERVTRKLAPGPAPSFTEAHVVKALEIIGSYNFVGRISLSRELGLGEGTTRTLLKHLKNEGIIQSSRRGISFSEDGKKLFSVLRSKLSEGVEIPSSPLTVGPFNVAVLVRNSAQAVRSGMEQRDIAIKSGASGATTLVFCGGMLSLPTGEENLFESMPSFFILFQYFYCFPREYHHRFYIVESLNLGCIGVTKNEKNNVSYIVCCVYVVCFVCSVVFADGWCYCG
jgi:predicted transcriptional regulator